MLRELPTLKLQIPISHFHTILPSLPSLPSLSLLLHSLFDLMEPFILFICYLIDSFPVLVKWHQDSSRHPHLRPGTILSVFSQSLLPPKVIKFFHFHFFKILGICPFSLLYFHSPSPKFRPTIFLAYGITVVPSFGPFFKFYLPQSFPYCYQSYYFKTWIIRNYIIHLLRIPQCLSTVYRIKPKFQDAIQSPSWLITNCLPLHSTTPSTPA